MCANGGCLTASLKCNGEPDCADGSDEVKLSLDSSFELLELGLKKQVQGK